MVDACGFLSGNGAKKLEKYRDFFRNHGILGPSVEIRTRGLLNPIQARYQTSPHPETYLVLLSCNLNIIAQDFPFVNN